MKARVLLACAAATAALLPAVAVGATAAEPAASVDHAGRWITDQQGRVLITHGVNMVYKLDPYAPDVVGFDDDDAAFLAEHGFDSVRVGLIWKAVEPEPGVYDDHYLDRIRTTVRTLARHGIMSQLDMHQDMYHERYQGEGAPDWAVQDEGLPAEPKLGFGPNYLFMAALNRAYDHFWANDPAPDGVGLQDHYAAAWAHVAAKFKDVPGVMGYDLFNEPWPGSQYPFCANPLGCPLQDTQILAAFHSRVRDAIRAEDAENLIWYEPFVIFNNGADTSHPPLAGRDGTKDRHAGFSFHDYCLFSPYTDEQLGCDPFDDLVHDNADAHAAKTGAALLLSEFGATDSASILTSKVDRAARHMISWQYWAYCGCNDPTTEGEGDVQAIVIDPAKPKAGDNVKWEKLKLLAVPNPRAVAGTPKSYGFDRETGIFRLSYTALRADGTGLFPGGAVTTVAVPRLHYPDGYRVQVSGARVVSGVDAPVLKLASLPGAAAVSVTVTPVT